MVYRKVTLRVSWVFLLTLSLSIFIIIDAGILNLRSGNTFTYNRENFVKRLLYFDDSSPSILAQNNSAKIQDRECQNDVDCYSGIGTNISSILGDYACVDNKCKYVVAAGERCNIDSDCAAFLYYSRGNQTVNNTLCSASNCNLNSECSSAWDPEKFKSPLPHFDKLMCCGGIKENDKCLMVATNVDPCDYGLGCELNVQGSSTDQLQYTCVSKKNSVMLGVIICLIGSTVLNIGLNIQKYAFTKHQEEFSKQELIVESLNEEVTINVSDGSIKQKGGSPLSLGANEVERGEIIVEKRTSMVESTRGTSNNIEHSRLYKKMEKFMFWKQIVVSPLWVVGFLIYLVGTMMGFIALQFAPQSLIAPLGAVSLVTNLLIAPILHSQKLTFFDIFGVVVIIGGSVVITVFSGVVSQGQSNYKLCVLMALFRRPSTIIYLSIISCFIAILIFFIKLESRNAETDVDDFSTPETTSENHNDRSSLEKWSIPKSSEERKMQNEIYLDDDENINNIRSRRLTLVSIEEREEEIDNVDWNRRYSVKSNGDSKSFLIKRRGFREKFLLPIAYAVLASSMATLTTLFAKSLINLLTQTFVHQDNQFNNLLSWIILLVTSVTAVGQVYWLNIGLKKYDALIQVPIFFCNWSLYDIIGGGIYYDEFKNFTTIKYLEFALGVMMIFFGVVLLSKRLAKLTKEEEELNASQKLVEKKLKEMKRDKNSKNEDV
ncbi:4315_t:CDS:2 [Acaulospora morrowiae]|uniref:4315_t:CDS:1 n=1 Tax=Acaulospora morrowiae TaxID=94023 RepID=A0A9N9FM04_9GLOM|nr:4315_t:CDS:2 [Acaulospora morrowiae]